MDTPAGAYSVEARGISDNNIVGYYSDYYGNYGFIYNRTMWTILEYPGAWMTFAEDISGNRVVGRYFDNSVNAHYEHGFVCNISDTPTTPIECKMKITPQAINRKSSQPRIQAVIRLPDSISPKDIDTGELLVLSPGSIKAVRQSLSAGNGITAEFDKDALMAATSNGNIEIKVTGKLTSGQYFYAADTVKIIH